MNTHTPPIADSLKVTAYLIYSDGTLSTFDVLNDKSIALWNTIIGEGDAVKPSDSTKLNVRGNLNGIKLTVNNGSSLVIDTVFTGSQAFDYVIKNTGCSEVYVKLGKRNGIIYNDTIPFHCGE